MLLKHYFWLFADFRPNAETMATPNFEVQCQMVERTKAEIEVASYSYRVDFVNSTVRHTIGLPYFASEEWQSLELVPDTVAMHPKHEVERMKELARLKRQSDQKQWAKQLEQNQQICYYSSTSFNSMVSQVQSEFNMKIFKAAQRFMNKLRQNSNSWHAKPNISNLKLTTPLSISNTGTIPDLQAIVAKTTLTAMQFYKSLTKKVPLANDLCTFENRMMSIEEKLHLFPLDVVVPAAFSLVFDLITEEPNHPNDMHAQILNSCPRSLRQEIIICLDFMKLTLAFTLSENDPISCIMQHEQTSHRAKLAAIGNLIQVLAAGLISNPIANPTTIANLMIESLPKEKKPKISNLPIVPKLEPSTKPKQVPSRNIEPAPTEPKTTESDATKALMAIRKIANESTAKIESKSQVHHCNNCKAFSNRDKSVVENHQRKCVEKASTNNHKCKDCNKTFAYYSGLSKHQRENRCKPINSSLTQEREEYKPIHDPSAPKNMKYKCPICHNYSKDDKCKVNRHIDSCFKKSKK